MLIGCHKVLLMADVKIVEVWTVLLTRPATLEPSIRECRPPPQCLTKDGSMAESVGQNGTPGGTHARSQGRPVCQNATSAEPDGEFFALARGLQRHPRQRASGDHMFEHISTHFRLKNESVCHD